MNVSEMDNKVIRFEPTNINTPSMLTACLREQLKSLKAVTTAVNKEEMSSLLGVQIDPEKIVSAEYRTMLKNLLEQVVTYEDDCSEPELVAEFLLENINGYDKLYVMANGFDSEEAA